jgi:hypothetical protein
MSPKLLDSFMNLFAVFTQKNFTAFRLLDLSLPQGRSKLHKAKAKRMTSTLQNLLNKAVLTYLLHGAESFLRS